jgi:N-acetylneuraminic acid mutarotase
MDASAANGRMTPTSQYRKLASIDSQTKNQPTPPQIICYGDYPDILKFNLNNLRWEKLKYDSSTSAYTGNLRYTGGAVTVNGFIYITGGSLVSSGEAVNTCFEARVSSPGRFIRKKSLLNKRYAHACVCINGYIYTLGGFDNRDADGVAPNTLDFCERYSLHENKWYLMCSMNEARAFAGVTAIGDQFIYLFGGFHDYDVLQSIEKYDAVLDSWVTLYVKLPVPLAKLGVAPIESGR